MRRASAKKPREVPRGLVDDLGTPGKQVAFVCGERSIDVVGRGNPVEALAGTIERVTFHSQETGFCVLKVHARGQRDLVPVVGHAPAIGAGAWITATGIWHTDRQHGLQFRADTLKITPPTGVEGIERYLASGHMRGIGPAMAKRIVAMFGEGTFEIIEAEPTRLTEVDGIGPKRAARIVSGWAEQKAVRDPVRDVQVLTPMQRGVLGARNLNHELQAVLNPNPSVPVERFGWRFSPGDRVMESQNDYDRETFNGDLGTVARIDEDEGAVIVSFDGREVVYPYGELDTLVPAYATTIHKSQGSEYPAVVIPLAMQHWTMLARNLLYTGVTRGKRLVVLIGQRKAVGIAVRGGNMRPRWTKLREWMAR